MFCTECGTKVEDDAVFCPHCGTRLNHDPNNAETPETAGDSAKPAKPDQAAPSVDESRQRTTVMAGQPAPETPADAVAPSGDALPDSALMPQTPDPRAPRVDATAVMPNGQSAGQVTMSAPGMEPTAPSGKNPYKTVAIVAGIVVVALLVVCGVIFALNAGAFGGGEPAETSSSQPSTTTSSEPSTASTSSSTATTPTVHEVAIPNVVGLSQSDALDMLSREGFATSSITEEHSVSTPEGFVISQSPTGGQMGDPSTVRVSLVVSSGPQETVTETEYTVVSRAMTWSDANAYCASQGGTLACITSQAEYDKVLAVAEQSGLHVLWLGGQRSGSSFSWVSGEPFSFSSWGPGEPNNDGGSENYLALYNVNGVWGWYDAPNDLSTTYPAHTMGFVMEREVQRTR